MSSTDSFAAGNVVVVRDEDWLITSVDESSDRPFPQRRVVEPESLCMIQYARIMNRLKRDAWSLGQSL